MSANQSKHINTQHGQIAELEVTKACGREFTTELLRVNNASIV